MSVITRIITTEKDLKKNVIQAMAHVIGFQNQTMLSHLTLLIFVFTVLTSTFISQTNFSNTQICMQNSCNL